MVKGQIVEGVVHRTAANTALYVDSFIAARLQELATQGSLSPETIRYLDNLISNTPLGQEVSIFKVWDLNGRVVYSSDPAIIGHTFPVIQGLAIAANGEVSGEISRMNKNENLLERGDNRRFLEVYSPIRRSGSSQVIAVVEFYQRVDALDAEIKSAQLQTIAGVVLAGISMYLLLVISFKRASDTIQRQQAELSAQVSQLTRVVAQNKELHERVRRAAARTADINERYLRRVSAELHDGPIQDLSLALLRLDNGIARSGNCPTAVPELEVVQASFALHHLSRDNFVPGAGDRCFEHEVDYKKDLICVTQVTYKSAPIRYNVYILWINSPQFTQTDQLWEVNTEG